VLSRAIKPPGVFATIKPWVRINPPGVLSAAKFGFVRSRVIVFGGGGGVPPLSFSSFEQLLNKGGRINNVVPPINTF